MVEDSLAHETRTARVENFLLRQQLLHFSALEPPPHACTAYSRVNVEFDAVFLLIKQELVFNIYCFLLVRVNMSPSSSPITDNVVFGALRWMRG